MIRKNRGAHITDPVALTSGSPGLPWGFGPAAGKVPRRQPCLLGWSLPKAVETSPVRSHQALRACHCATVTLAPNAHAAWPCDALPLLEHLLCARCFSRINSSSSFYHPSGRQAVTVLSIAPILQKGDLRLGDIKSLCKDLAAGEQDQDPVPSPIFFVRRPRGGAWLGPWGG